MKNHRVLGLTVLCGWLIMPAAWAWQSPWQTADQRAQHMMQSGQYAEAADTFQRMDWRATAAFRSGDYQRAAREYAQVPTADGHYNAGNALAKLGQYPQAIAQYDQALALDPHHADAMYNRRLLQEHMQQQPNPEQSKDSQQDSSHRQPSPSSSSEKGSQTSGPTQTKQEDTSSQPSDTPNKKAMPKDNPSQQSQPDTEAHQPKSAASHPPDKTTPKPLTRAEREQNQADAQWLQLIPDDPGGLLREKFMRDHVKRRHGWQP